MYLKKLSSKQINEMLKKMLMEEAKMMHFYSQNLSKILDGTIYDYKLKSKYNKDYLVVNISNGDIFVFDDCSYIKFEKPDMSPVSYEKNTNDYLNYMRNNFNDYEKYEIDYINDAQNVVDIVNFCEDMLATKNAVKEKSRFDDIEYAY